MFKKTILITAILCNFTAQALPNNYFDDLNHGRNSSSTHCEKLDEGLEQNTEKNSNAVNLAIISEPVKVLVLLTDAATEPYFELQSFQIHEQPNQLFSLSDCQPLFSSPYSIETLNPQPEPNFQSNPLFQPNQFENKFEDKANHFFLNSQNTYIINYPPKEDYLVVVETEDKKLENNEAEIKKNSNEEQTKNNLEKISDEDLLLLSLLNPDQNFNTAQVPDETREAFNQKYIYRSPKVKNINPKLLQADKSNQNLPQLQPSPSDNNANTIIGKTETNTQDYNNQQFGDHSYNKPKGSSVHAYELDKSNVLIPTQKQYTRQNNPTEQSFRVYSSTYRNNYFESSEPPSISDHFYYNQDEQETLNRIQDIVIANSAGQWTKIKDFWMWNYNLAIPKGTKLLFELDSFALHDGLAYFGSKNEWIRFDGGSEIKSNDFIVHRVESGEQYNIVAIVPKKADFLLQMHVVGASLDVQRPTVYYKNRSNKHNNHSSKNKSRKNSREKSQHQVREDRRIPNYSYTYAEPQNTINSELGFGYAWLSTDWCIDQEMSYEMINNFCQKIPTP